MNGVAIGTARSKWEQDREKAHADIREACMPGPRFKTAFGRSQEAALIEALLSEIIAIRIEERLVPIFNSLARMERGLTVLTDLRTEHWAHSTHPINARQQRRAP